MAHVLYMEAICALPSEGRKKGCCLDVPMCLKGPGSGGRRIGFLISLVGAARKIFELQELCCGQSQGNRVGLDRDNIFVERA
jgi:hypothetical protein